jgi:putative hydrolase of the HAD superfamily
MTELWRIHTLVFDLDDTLYVEADFVHSGFRAVDDWLRSERGIDGFLACATGLFAAGRRKRIFDETLLLLKLPTDTALVADMLAVYRGHSPGITLPSESESVLDWASTRFHLALVTDGYAGVQRKKLAALGVDRWVQCCVVTDELGRDQWKPHPAGFERVMARFPGLREGYVYVGDNPGKDFIAPRQLGWRTIRLRRAEGEHAASEAGPGGDAGATIEELSALRRMLIPKSQPV